MKTTRAIIIVVLSLSGCNKKDKTCEAPGLNVNIVGKWEAAFKTTPEQITTIEFTNNKAYTEDEDLLLGSYYSPKATWNVKDDTLFVAATYSNGSKTNYTFSIVENKCDEIMLDLDGLDKLKLKRL
jgi:hypothetical protein